MAKTLLYRIFGFGKIPEQLAATLKAEGLLLLDEGIRGTVTYLNFHSPVRYANWKRQWYTAALALTKVRLVGLRFSTTIIDVPFTDERIRSMQLSLEGQDTLLIAFDASLFHKDWSGNIEYRFRTPQAGAFLEMIRKRIG